MILLSEGWSESRCLGHRGSDPLPTQGAKQEDGPYDRGYIPAQAVLRKGFPFGVAVPRALLSTRSNEEPFLFDNAHLLHYTFLKYADDTTINKKGKTAPEG